MAVFAFGSRSFRHIYKGKSRGEQEVWDCKLYRQKGKVDGCDSPTLYTKEIQEVLNNIYKSIYDNKDLVINGLFDIYSGFESKDYTYNIKLLEKELEKIHIKKDRLLDLNIEGQISNAEFASRNDRLNQELEAKQAEINSLYSEIEKDNLNKQDLAKLKKALEQEFKNGDNSNAELNNIFLDRIIVHKINGSKKHVKLEIVLKLGNTYFAELDKENNNHFLSLEETGIFQGVSNG